MTSLERYSALATLTSLGLGLFGCGGADSSTTTESTLPTKGGTTQTSGGAAGIGGSTARVGGFTSTGGVPASGGTTHTGIGTASGGVPSIAGGSSTTGGSSVVGVGGTAPTGGKPAATGGVPQVGSTTLTGGAAVQGGSSAAAATSASGGTNASGGATPAGGTSGLAGASSPGGSKATGGNPASGGTSNGGNSSTGGTIGSGGTGGISGTGGASLCTGQTQSIAMALSRFNLIFLLDKSGSMGNDPSGYWSNAENRWNPVVQTIDAFIADPKSNGIYAQLSIFPANGTNTLMCSIASYGSAPNSTKIPLTLVDDTSKSQFYSYLCDPTAPLGPTCIVPAGGTPTRPALQGIIQLELSLAQQYPESRTAIVLITDGEPGFGYADSSGSVYALASCDDLTNGCTANPGQPPCTTLDGEVGNIAAVIAGAPARSIFLVGVGDLTSSTMDIWAAASGNPGIALQNLTGAEAATMLSQLLQSIRSQAASCSVAIPAQSGGGAVDPSKVNVSVVVNGVPQDVRRTQNGTASTCTSTNLGWYFDNPSAPTQINLCPSTCASARAAAAEPSFVFGCATQVFEI